MSPAKMYASIALLRSEVAVGKAAPVIAKDEVLAMCDGAPVAGMKVGAAARVVCDLDAATFGGLRDRGPDRPSVHVAVAALEDAALRGTEHVKADIRQDHGFGVSLHETLAALAFEAGD